MIDSDDMIVEGDAFGNIKAGAPAACVPSPPSIPSEQVT
jgi:hypothetical protein